MKKTLATELNNVYKHCICGSKEEMRLISLKHSLIGKHIVTNVPYLKCNNCGETRELSYLRFLIRTRVRSFKKKVVDFNFLLKTS